MRKLWRVAVRFVHPSWAVTWLAVGVAAGVIASFVFDLTVFGSMLWLAVAAVFLLFAILRPQAVIIALAFFAGFLCGAVRTNLAIGDVRILETHYDKEVMVSGHIYDDPDEQEGSLALRLNRLQIGNDLNAEVSEINANLYVTVSAKTSPKRGDIIAVSGKLQEGFGSFAGVMWRSNVVQVLTPEPGDWARQARDWFAERVKAEVKSPEADIGLGYLLGQKRGISVDAEEKLRIVGLTHMVVASGYHLMVMVRLAKRGFKNVSRFAAIFVSGLVIICFTAITGAGPSMMRAGIVAGLSLIAWYYHRKFHPVKLILLALAITLMMNPHYVIDVGWLLSFASFAGIMILAPLITAYFYGGKGLRDEDSREELEESDVPLPSFHSGKVKTVSSAGLKAFLRKQERMAKQAGKPKKEKGPNFLAQIIIETMAAQICTLPIILYFIGDLSMVALFSNILIGPTVSLTMAALCFTGAFHALVPFLSFVFARVSELVLGYHLAVINWLSELPWAMREMPIGWVGLVAMYVGILLAMVFLRVRSGYRLSNVNVIE